MSTVGIKFNLLQAASTAEDVAPWVQLRKPAIVYILYFFERSYLRH